MISSNLVQFIILGTEASALVGPNAVISLSAVVSRSISCVDSAHFARGIMLPRDEDQSPIGVGVRAGHEGGRGYFVQLPQCYMQLHLLTVIHQRKWEMHLDSSKYRNFEVVTTL
jgi:hypothetical protein